MFKTIQQIVRQHLGIEQILEEVYDNIGDVEKLVLLGDYAKGIDSGTIEVLIIGKKIDKEYLDMICPKIEKKINRSVNFILSNKILNQNYLVIFDKQF